MILNIKSNKKFSFISFFKYAIRLRSIRYIQLNNNKRDYNISTIHLIQMKFQLRNIFITHFGIGQLTRVTHYINQLISKSNCSVQSVEWLLFQLTCATKLQILTRQFFFAIINLKKTPLLLAIWDSPNGNLI